MMKNRLFALIVGGLILSVMTWFLVQTYLLSKEKQILQYNLAEINSLKYGLFDETKWNGYLSGLMTEQIAEFELTGANRGVIKEGVTSILNHGVDNIDQLIQFKRSNGGLLQAALKALSSEITIDKEVLREQVPALAEDIVQHLEKPSTQAELKAYLTDKISNTNWIRPNTSGNALGPRLEKYKCSDIEQCRTNFLGEIESKKQSIWELGMIVLAIMIGLIGLRVTFPGIFSLNLVILGALLLLIGGVITPMIDIEAGIEKLDLLLMGQPIVFEDQVLFFQSKSILEVVELLFQNSDISTVLVGVLILVFSILFPVSKLLLSWGALNQPQIAKSKLTQFFLFKSAKWSMADVFVVALFMAYIGMERMVGGQLQQLSGNGSGINEITTTEGTSLQIGFSFFLAFCIINLFLSSWVKKALKSTPEEEAYI